MRGRDTGPVLLIVVSAAFAACGGGGVLGGLVGAPKTTVSITNKITSLQAGQSYQFNVTADHDQGAGFNVTLTGAGTLVPFGQGATYVAPASPPNPNTVTVTATDKNGSQVSDSDTFTISAAAGPVVTISPATFTVTGGGAAFTLNITVTQDNPSDTLSGGVSGAPGCNGSCGSFGLFNGTPGGGSYTVLFIPGKSITATTTQTVQVFSSLANSTPGTALVTENAGTGGTSSGCTLQGFESVLTSAQTSERWMFLVRGQDAGQSTAMAALFEPDGNGGIASGVEDINTIGSAPELNEAIDPTKSAYSVDSTGRGCLQLATATSSKVFHFALDGVFGGGPPVSGEIAEYDDTTGSGTRALGRMETALGGSTSGGSTQPANFIFGLQGFDSAGGHVGIAGYLATDGNGNITSGLSDSDDAGAVSSSVSVASGTYSGASNGRVTFSFMNGTTPVNGVIYVGTASDLFLLSTDQVSSSTPLLSGRAVTTTGGGGLPGYWVFGDSGKDNAAIATANLAQGGSFTGTIWQDKSGTTSNSAISGTYTLTDSTLGRATFSGNHPVVAYVAGGAGGGRGFIVGTDKDASAGEIYQLPSPPGFSDKTFQNIPPNTVQTGYHDIQITSSGITTTVGVISFDGNGNFTGTVDVSAPTGLTPDAGLTGTYNINSDGSGTINGFPLVTDGAHLLFIDETTGVIHARVTILTPPRAF
jgi:hypothetical protein